MSNARFFGVATINHDQRNVLVLTPYIQTAKNSPVKDIDFNHSLIVDIDSLNNDVGEQLTKMANNYHAGEFKTLMEYFEGKSLRNSDRVLAWLMNNKQIQKVPSDLIIMRGSKYTFKEINDIIKADMEKKQPARDVDDARREQARQYNEELKESKDYPDFNNPSDRGEIPPLPEFDETIEHVTKVPEEYSQYPEPVPLTTQPISSDEVKRIHEALVEQYKQSDDKLQSALDVVSQLKDTLSDSAIQTLSEELKHKASSVDAKDVLVEALAQHYKHVDVEYIKKNLDAAERRKSKD